MIAATISYPLVGAGGTHQWTERIRLAIFQHTLPTIFGAGNGWLAIAPVLLAFAGAVAFAVRSVPAFAISREQIRWGWLALGIWGLLAGVVAPAFGEEQIGGRLAAPTGFIDHRGQSTLVIVALLAGAACLVLMRVRSRQTVDDERAGHASPHPEPDRRPAAPARPRRTGEVVGVEYYGAHAEAPQPVD